MDTPPTNTAASDSTSALEAGRAAFAKRRWEVASESLAAADSEQTLGAQDLEHLGEALWWKGRLGEAIEVRQRAFQAYRSSGDARSAARVALQLMTDHQHGLEGAIAAGWLARAQRLLSELPESQEHATLGRARLASALDSGDLDEALRIADSNLDVAARLNDPDIEAVGLQDRARVLVAMGRVDEGMELLNEAVVAAVSGELSAHPAGIIYCNATITCEDLTDYRRAAEFADAAKRWCESEDITGFPGMCRVRRVEIIRLKGDWAAAEAEAQKACEELKDFSPAYSSEGFYQIGEVRLRRRDLDAAEEAFSEAHRLGRDPLPGMAMLRLAQGDAESGAALMARALTEQERGALGRARLLPSEVALALELEDLPRAQRARAELSQIAETFKTHLLRAESQQAAGHIALVEGDTDAAIGALRESVREWQATDAPWETALARTLLGEAYLAAGEAGAAGLEFAAAVSTFDDLGATADAQRAQGFIDGSIKPRSAPLQPQTAQRTFMFTDIVRSTNLLEAVGDEAWAQLLAWHDAAIRRIVAENQGQEVDHAGDGFFLAFESADDALSCALTVRSTLLSHRRQSGFAPDVRMGLHSTDALRTEEGYAGGGVHIAARVGALADGGQILVSRAVIEAATETPPHGPWRDERLKGIAEPIELATLD